MCDHPGSHIARCAAFRRWLRESLKNEFKKELLRFQHIFHCTSQTDQARAFIEASQTILTRHRCEQAFQRAGIFPANPQAILASPYVKDGSAPEEPQRTRGYNINAKELTDNNTLTEIWNYQISHAMRPETDLEMRPIDVGALEQMCLNETNFLRGRLLTRIHPRS